MRSKDKIYEEYLVAAARTGDRVAFAALVKLRGPKLFAHAYRLLGNRDEALDATQDSWVEILKGLPRLQEVRAFPVWALRIVSRRCGKVVKGNIHRRELAATAKVETETITPEAGPAASDAHVVRAALETLPPEQAATIRLFYLEDLSVREVAVALDIPIGTVKTRLMHARQKLQHTLKGDYDV